jgi:hypothetical protein
MQDPARDSGSPSWQIALRRPVGAAGWQADLVSPNEYRHFESLAHLIRWLGQLDSPAPTRQISGIR